VFYTKYRPQKFSEIIRPNEAADALSTQIKNNKTVHAYLFIGPRGTAKTTAARILAKALNCSKTLKNGDPCGRCMSCKEILKGSYIDLIEIDAASNRGIDDIRALQDKINLVSAHGGYKTYIIDEVHMLTPPAFNALLKTLEEPPPKTVFVLCTTEAYKVPDTVKSRCQVFKFKRATIEQLVKKLELIVKEEKVKVSKETLEKIAQASFGGFRDAETILQQVVEGEIEAETLLDAASIQTLKSFVESLMSGNSDACLKIINEVYGDGVDLSVWAGELLRYLRDVLLIKESSHEGLVDVTVEALKDLTKLAEKADRLWLVQTIRKFAEAQRDVKRIFIPQLPLEIAVVETIVVKEENVTETDTEDTVKKNDKKVVKVEPLKATFPEIKSKWNDIIVKMESINTPIQGMLKTSKLVGLEENFAILEVYFSFHKERLECNKNRKIIENLLHEIYGENVRIKCVVSSKKPEDLKKKETGVLTDINVVPISEAGDLTKLMDVFDGSLPT